MQVNKLESIPDALDLDERRTMIALIRQKDACLDWIIKNSSCRLAQQMAKKARFATLAEHIK